MRTAVSAVPWLAVWSFSSFWAASSWPFWSRTLILLLLFLTAFVWTAVLLMMLLAARLRWLRWDVTHAFAFRLAITVFTIVLLCAVAQVNVVRLCCRLSFRFYPVQFSNWLIDSLSSSLADRKIRAPLWFLATLRPAAPSESSLIIAAARYRITSSCPAYSDSWAWPSFCDFQPSSKASY